MKEINNKLYWELGNLREEAGKCKRMEIRVFQWAPVSPLRVTVRNDMSGREGQKMGTTALSVNFIITFGLWPVWNLHSPLVSEKSSQILPKSKNQIKRQEVSNPL